jgi:hypothetical protein
LKFMLFCVIDGFCEKGKPAHGDEGAVPPHGIDFLRALVCLYCIVFPNVILLCGFNC